jgi:xylulokinase
MPGHLLLGIDIGTSSSKGVLCTSEGEILASATMDHQTSFPKSGWAEHDADAVWWDDFVAICRRLLSGKYGGEDVGAVGVSAIGPCMLPIDSSGRPLRAAILYGIDSRATAEIAWLENRYGQDSLYQRGGMMLTSQSVGPKILWLRNHEPKIFSQTAMVHSSSDYIVYRLTAEHVLDRHTASAFNPLFNMERLEWDDQFSHTIIEQDRLPRLADANEVAGTVTPAASSETGLKIGTPVAAGTIDVAAESISVGVVNPGEMMLMYGSTMFLLNLVGQFRPDRRLWTGAYSLPGRRVMTGGMATSGLITKWFRDELAAGERWNEIKTSMSAYQQLGEQAATIGPGSDGLVCLPYFAGERTPIFDPDARGIFAGLTLRHTRGHLYRSVLEGVGYAVRHHLEIMRELKCMPDRIIAVGGGTQSDLWLQIVSDIAGVTQLIPQKTIGASYGDAFLAGLAAGIIPSTDALADGWVRIARAVEPDLARSAVYDEYYGIYRALYENTKDQAHALSRLGRNG